MEEKTCISCKKKIVNDKGYTTFNCPKCSKYPLTRCSFCRVNAVHYTCPECGFTGPN